MNKGTKRVLKGIHVTEKASVLQGLAEAESNASLKKCKSPKRVFLVDIRANKYEIKTAVEEFFAGKQVTVTKVNTITLPRKNKRARGSRKMGAAAQIKKAVVTFKEGDELDLEA